VSNWENRPRPGVPKKTVDEMQRLVGLTVERSEEGCGRHIREVAQSLLQERIEVPDRKEPVPWSTYFGNNINILTRSAKGTFHGVASSSLGRRHIAFFEIIDCALEWSLPKEHLEVVFVDTAQGDVQIDGPRRLKEGQAATYRVRVLGGLLPPDKINWNVPLQETKGGLRGVGLGGDRSISVVATESSGRGELVAMCEWNDHPTKNGRAVIELVPGR